MSLGYAIFLTSAFNSPEGRYPQVVIDLDGPVGDVTTFVNGGRYTTIVNVFGWSLRAVFD